MVNAFSNFFSTVLNNISFCSLLDSSAYVTRHFRTAVELNCKIASTSVFSFTDFTELSISKKLESLDPCSSPGIVGIDTRVLKHCHSELAPILTRLFNECLRSSSVPEDWKVAFITPILKAKAPKSALTSYRPISILPPIAKVFEGLLARQISAHFENNNLLSDNQFGFRHNRSCELALNSMCEYWKHHLNEGHRTIAVLLDLSKAFDTINHDLLVEKLRLYKFDQAAITIINSYLQQRYNVVKQGDLKSKMELLRTGVPQGSILGPLLFIIFINDINYLNISSKLFIYADDTTVTYACESLVNLVSTITTDLATISSWLHHNHLILNVAKTQSVDFAISNRGRKREQAPPLVVNGQVVNYVDKFTLLGVSFDKFLKFDDHTINICKKINIKIFILSRCAHLFHLNFKTVLFKLFIQSHFDYCSTVYSHLSVISTSRINRCFSRALRKLLNINIKNMDIDQQLATLSPFNILPLALRRFNRFITFLYSICKYNNTSFLFLNIFKNRNLKDNLITPKCHTDLLKYSFTSISIKILNLFLLANLFRPKNDFLSFIKTNSLKLFLKSTDFFS
jgi:hypothetical protein